GYVGVSHDWSCMDAASKQYRHKMRGCYGKQSRRMEKRQPVKRTELCAFFAAGMCTRGSRCTFAHGAAQLRPRPDLYKT
ncbi:BCKDK, partial [Symbiodinium necroappetens]